jgi:hypothetical protein
MRFTVSLQLLFFVDLTELLRLAITMMTFGKEEFPKER